jgi:hypothetical protein
MRGRVVIRRLAFAAVLPLAIAGCAATRAPFPRSGAETNGFARPSTPDEIIALLGDLAAGRDDAELLTIGHSAGGRPLGALSIAAKADPYITLMIIGSQHGTEPSGGEALQILARAILSGQRDDLRAHFRLILVPDANPDGRADHRRVNGNGVNLSTNYNVASEPETRAVLDALSRWQPDVVLDVHESAILKKKTLGAQGYMTDFQAQVEIGNNPNIDVELQALSGTMLDEVVDRINAAGVAARHYIGEITDVAQPITHGGLSVKNLRNTAAMHGAVSFLIENRLDPAGPDYPTPRNLRGRIEKQLASIEAFLAVCVARREAIARTVEQARARAATPDEREISLVARWAANPSEPEITVPLRRLDDGAVERRVFARHDVIEALRPLAVPSAYAVTAHQNALRVILDRHHIAYTTLSAPVSASVIARRIAGRIPVPGLHGWAYTDYDLVERDELLSLPAGTLWIDLAQPLRRLIPLLIEPRSNGSVFQDPEYGKLVEVGAEFFIQRVE